MFLKNDSNSFLLSKPQISVSLSEEIISFERPLVMSIINITPDSFFAPSRCACSKEILSHIEKSLNDGAYLFDIGAYSSRPHAAYVSEQEEAVRLFGALEIIRKEFPDIRISIDTFRAGIAAGAVEQFNANIINDISGGTLDSEMFATVARLGVPYILMHMKGTPQNMHEQTDYTDFISEIVLYFANRISKLEKLGVKDIILDPGFGFAKTTEQNFFLLKNMSILQQFDRPILVGLSRKSMIQKTLNITAEDALNGTTALNMLALTQGASILRVHDTREASEAVALYQTYNTAQL